MRYGFLHVASFGSPFRIGALRRVCQILPVNYLGAFATSDSRLNRVWHTGAYTVKVNLEPGFFNSILIDRGDRISWTGRHLSSSLATALV